MSRYWPASFVTALNFNLVAVFVAVISAPRTTPPAGSVTKPPISATFIWAKDTDAQHKNTRTRLTVTTLQLREKLRCNDVVNPWLGAHRLDSRRCRLTASSTWPLLGEGHV